MVHVSTIIRQGKPHDSTSRRRAAFYRKRAAELVEAAAHTRDAADQHHLVALAATYVHAAKQIRPQTDTVLASGPPAPQQWRAQ